MILFWHFVPLGGILRFSFFRFPLPYKTNVHPQTASLEFSFHRLRTSTAVCHIWVHIRGRIPKSSLTLLLELDQRYQFRRASSPTPIFGRNSTGIIFLPYLLPSYPTLNKMSPTSTTESNSPASIAEVDIGPHYHRYLIYRQCKWFRESIRIISSASILFRFLIVWVVVIRCRISPLPQFCVFGNILFWLIQLIFRFYWNISWIGDWNKWEVICDCFISVHIIILLHQAFKSIVRNCFRMAGSKDIYVC